MAAKDRRYHVPLSDDDRAYVAALGKEVGIHTMAGVLRFAVREACRLRGVSVVAAAPPPPSPSKPSPSKPPPPKRPRKRR